MSEIVIARLAKRLLKCPFDGDIFDSSLGLRVHLCETHGAQICQQIRLMRPDSVECSEERPNRLYCCPQCDFAIPERSYPSATTERGQHIKDRHRNPSGPTSIGFRTSEDESLIDGFMESQQSIAACACLCCSKNFADEASVAEHWVELLREEVTVEEARLAYDADPERFRIQLGEIFSEVAEEDLRKRLALREPDDGYIIHHVPSVPRVRRKPGEYDVYIESERVTFLDRELDELLEREGWDIADDAPFGTEWSEGRQQSTSIELRFCNIVDGYIPLGKEIRCILPPTGDGEIVEVAWEGKPGAWFPCKVSRSKRAIYNHAGRLKSVFAPFPSGVRLYITRVGPRRYRLGVKRHQHRVPNCKWFFPDGHGGWTVEIRDEDIEWETGDEVFRHHLTFVQMEALYHEATTSVRDAVHTAMKRLAQGQPVHVRTVHDAVFLWIRTCSLAAVWAQFRPEHSCYVRVQPGWYRFDPAGHLPTVRHVQPRNDRLPEAPRESKRYKIRGRGWRHNIFPSRLNQYRDAPDAVLDVCLGFGTLAEARFIIPIPYLLEHVIPHAHCNERNQYLFSVSPHDHAFTWDYGVRREGKPFLHRGD